MQPKLNADVAAMLDKVIKAHQGLTAFSCDVQSQVQGIVRPSGRVRIAFEKPHRLWIETRPSNPRDKSVTMVCDGKMFYLTKPKRLTYAASPIPPGGNPLRAAFLSDNPLPLPIFGWLLSDPDPRSKLLGLEILAVEALPDQTINGVLCQTLSFRSRPERGSSTLSFGKQDGLLRRVTATVTRPNQSKIEIVENYLQVQRNPKLPADLWRFRPPAGLREENTPRPPLPPPPSLGPGAVKTETGLQYLDLKVGTGAVARNGSTVAVHYTGWLTNGEEFDSSYDRGVPFEITLPARVIAGWNEGLLGMRAGGKRKLVIPPNLAYGERASGAIPAMAVLIFELELVSVKG